MGSKQLKEEIASQFHLNPLTTYLGMISGSKTKTLARFLKEISVAFLFPDYYSGNLNSFLEIINDLSWLEKQDYILAITESHYFLNEESSDIQADIKRIFASISKEWANVPNYLNENEFRKRARFIVHYIK